MAPAIAQIRNELEPEMNGCCCCCCCLPARPVIHHMRRAPHAMPSHLPSNPHETICFECSATVATVDSFPFLPPSLPPPGEATRPKTEMLLHHRKICSSGLQSSTTSRTRTLVRRNICTSKSKRLKGRKGRRRSRGRRRNIIAQIACCSFHRAPIVVFT